MKTYTPDSILTFGKNKGFSLKEVYQFEPSYISWLIEYKFDFVINIKDFESLPKPTPFFKSYSNGLGGNSFIPDDSHVLHAKEHIKTGGSIAQVDFVFEDKLLNILRLKKEANYYPPVYTSINDSKRLSMGELFD